MALSKFAIAPDGALVYRNTGNIVRGNITYATSRETLTRGYNIVDNRVYHNGRLQGYIGNPTKNQQININKRAITRNKRKSTRASQHRSARTEYTATKEFIEYGGGPSVQRGGWETATLGKRTLEAYQTGINQYFEGSERVLLKYEETRQLNFASVLSQSVDANIITVEKANQMWDEYIKGDSETRSKLWDEINKANDEMGHEIISPPLFGEMARDLGIDIDNIARYL